VLPALPAMLLLFARQFPSLSDRLRRTPALACIAVGAAIAAFAVALPAFAGRLPWKEFVAEYSVWLLCAALVLAAAGIASLLLHTRMRFEAAFAAAGVGSLLAIQLVVSGTHVMDEHYSSERLIEEITGGQLQFPRDPPFYSVGSYD